MDIKLFVCCHRPVEVLEHPLLFPLQVGAALAGEHFPGFLHDDTGDHISHKNRSYCELTGHYWAWKNVDADYYGFFHYRRYLYPIEGEGRPYQIERPPSLERLDRLGYKEFADVISETDLIVPTGEDMRVSVREHYARARFHRGKDLKLVEQILAERSPEYVPAAERYLSGTICYFGNIFVMKRQLFQEYCNWLFPILEEFDRRTDTNDYSPEEQRVDGYLAERLLGVFITRVKEEGAGTLELPRVHFVEKRIERWQKRCVNFVVPPGSRRRAALKSWMSRIG